MRLYDELADWYRLLTPPEEYEEEAALYLATMREAVPAAGTLLELGAGAGHNASFFARELTCTLTDLSPRMLALSEELNPGSEHLLGDMRTLRLERTFDLVFAHDALDYLRTADELDATARTLFAHTRAGGAALLVPDDVRETFREHTEVIERSDGERALRCLEWTWDPDPSDTEVTVDYAFLLREGGEVRHVHDQHIAGLFERARWIAALERAGFSVERRTHPFAGGENDMFLALRPRA